MHFFFFCCPALNLIVQPLHSISFLIFGKIFFIKKETTKKNGLISLYQVSFTFQLLLVLPIGLKTILLNSFNIHEMFDVFYLAGYSPANFVHEWDLSPANRSQFLIEMMGGLFTVLSKFYGQQMCIETEYILSFYYNIDSSCFCFFFFLFF